MIGITLIAGAAVLGWINGQAKVSESAYGVSAANNVNFLKERFVEESQTFSGSGAGGACSGGTSPYTDCTGASFYLYNNGAVAFSLASIQIASTSSCPNTLASCPLNIVLYASCPSSGTCSTTVTCPNAANKCNETISQPSNCYPTIVNAGGAGAPTGFYVASGSTSAVPPSLPIGSLSTGTLGPYLITLPSCGGTQLYMYDTVAYTVTFTGLYGNTVQETITANG